MIKLIQRFKDYVEYKASLKHMHTLIKRQKEIPADNNGNLTGDNKKLFEFYTLAYILHANKVLEYQSKYHH